MRSTTRTLLSVPAGVDGKASLSFKERFELEKLLESQAEDWKHLPLREIPIPKKDGTKRVLKVPTIPDRDGERSSPARQGGLRGRAVQCLIKYAVEPAHEALFHPRSYGFV